MPIDDVTANAQHLLSLLLLHKRHAKQNNGACSGAFCKNCQKPYLPILCELLQQKKPIILILPAFPAKSANRQKTISSAPDLGEVLGLTYLNNLCKQIHTLHPPGVQLIIASDGRVFNDLVMVDNHDVDLYQQGLKDILVQHQLTYLSLFSLDEVYPHTDYFFMRTQLMKSYGESLIAHKKALKVDEIVRYQWNGIHRFILEDQLALKPCHTKNQIRKEAKTIAHHVILRSNAWSRLLASRFPKAIRLSIHPQICGSDKLGIQLLPTAHRWATPWHNVLLKNEGGYQLIPRKEAERLGATFQKDHYILEEK